MKTINKTVAMTTLSGLCAFAGIVKANAHPADAMAAGMVGGMIGGAIPEAVMGPKENVVVQQPVVAQPVVQPVVTPAPVVVQPSVVQPVIAPVATPAFVPVATPGHILLDTVYRFGPRPYHHRYHRHLPPPPLPRPIHRGRCAPMPRVIPGRCR